MTSILKEIGTSIFLFKWKMTSIFCAIMEDNLEFLARKMTSIFLYGRPPQICWQKRKKTSILRQIENNLKFIKEYHLKIPLGPMGVLARGSAHV